MHRWNIFFFKWFLFFFFFWKYQFLKIFCNLVGSIFLDIFALVRYLIDRFDTAGVRKKRQNDFTDTIFFSPCHRDLNIAIANISQITSVNDWFFFYKPRYKLILIRAID